MNGTCTLFSASVGVDDEVGQRRRLGRLPGLRRRDQALRLGHDDRATTATKAVSVDVTGKTTLQLVVTDAGDGNDYDHGDWADAKLTCGGGDRRPTRPRRRSRATTPASGATGVATSVAPTATFSEAIDPTTISGTTFSLVKTGTTTALAATVTYDAPTKTATLTPSAALTASTGYTATVKGGTGGVKDVAGNLLAANVTWTFTTAAGDLDHRATSRTWPTPRPPTAGARSRRT